MTDEIVSEYSRGFEHAVRNISATLAKMLMEYQDNPERRIALALAYEAARSHHGQMGNDAVMCRHCKIAKVSHFKCGDGRLCCQGSDQGFEPWAPPIPK